MSFSLVMLDSKALFLVLVITLGFDHFLTGSIHLYNLNLILKKIEKSMNESYCKSSNISFDL